MQAWSGAAYLVTDPPDGDTTALGGIEASLSHGSVVVVRGILDIKLSDGNLGNGSTGQLLKSTLDSGATTNAEMRLSTYRGMLTGRRTRYGLPGVTYQFRQWGHPRKSTCRRSSASG